jgi:hypothetical protein
VLSRLHAVAEAELTGLAEKFDDERLRAGYAECLGMSAFFTGDLSDGAELLERALAGYRAVGDALLVFNALVLLAACTSSSTIRAARLSLRRQWRRPNDTKPVGHGDTRCGRSQFTVGDRAAPVRPQPSCARPSRCGWPTALCSRFSSKR